MPFSYVCAYRPSALKPLSGARSADLANHRGSRNEQPDCEGKDSASAARAQAALSLKLVTQTTSEPSSALRRVERRGGQ